jgi:mannose-1-phosphate guanylyltransferase
MTTPRPTRAMILAAGYGTRMGPLSSDLPKAMIPLWGKPSLGHMIDLMQRWGVKEVLVNLHHNPDPIVEYLRGNRWKGVNISLSFEADIMGTGGALKHAEWFLRNEHSFWVANADVAADASPTRLLREYGRNNTIAALWLEPNAGPRTVEMSRGRISSFNSDCPGSADTHTFCGVHLVSPAILSHIPRGYSSIIDAYRSAMRSGKRVAGVTLPDSFWADIGNPQQYLDAHRSSLARHRNKQPGASLVDPGQLRAVRDLRKAGVKITGFAAVAETASVSPGAHIHDSVIWNEARIGRHARISNAIVSRGTHINTVTTGPTVTHTQVPASGPLEIALRKLHWSPKATTVSPLPARGSARSFTRIACGRKTAMLMEYSESRSENLRYARHTRFLQQAGWPVPAILLDMGNRNALLIEDVGTESLQDRAASLNVCQLERLYAPIVDSLADLHAISSRAIARKSADLEPAFSPRLYRWERELMALHFLKGYLHLNGRTIAAIADELRPIGRCLHRQPQVLIHRDMQSSNVMMQRGRHIFIDFQGMRFGPAAYDLASLLCDPYVMLPERLQLRLLARYIERTGGIEGRAAGTFWLAAVQRLSQALGAYGRLTALPGVHRFELYIPPAIRMISRALKHVPDLRADELRKLTKGFGRQLTP